MKTEQQERYWFRPKSFGYGAAPVMGRLAPDPWFDGGYWRDPRCDFSLSADMAQPPHLPSDLFDCRDSDAVCNNHRVATQNKRRLALAFVMSG